MNLELYRVRKALKAMAIVRKQVTLLYGKACPDYDASCIVCHMHRMVDVLHAHLKSDEKDYLEELA